MKATRQPKGQADAAAIRALKQIVKQVSWLDGILLWHEGKLHYRHQNSMVAPDAGLIARTQRSLNQTRQFWTIAGQTIAEPDRWLEEKKQQLILAKHFRAASVEGIEALAQKAKSADLSAVESLIPLLVMESLIVNVLPHSPSFALTLAGGAAQKPLIALFENRHLPDEARALALLTLGSVQRQQRDFKTQATIAGEKSGWFERALYWGLKYGFPSHPTIIVRLLKDEEGLNLAKRYLFASEVCHCLKLTPAQVNEMLLSGVPSNTVISIIEALATIEPAAESLLEYRNDLPDASEKRMSAAARLKREREELLNGVKDRIQRLALATRSARTPVLCSSFIQAMRTLRPLDATLSKCILRVLDECLAMPDELKEPYLKLIVHHHSRLWIEDHKAHASAEKPIILSLANRLKHRIIPFSKVLKQIKNVEVINHALLRNRLTVLIDNEWKSDQHCRLMLDIMDEFEELDEYWNYTTVLKVINCFASASDARRALEPILRACARAEKSMRGHFLICGLDSLPSGKRQIKEMLSHLPPLIERLASTGEMVDAEDCPCIELLVSSLNIIKADRESSEELIDWLFDFYRKQSPLATWRLRSMLQGVKVAITLGAEYRSRLPEIVASFSEHKARVEDDIFKAALATLGQVPEMHPTFARLFPIYPTRSMHQLVLLTLASRFSPRALNELRQLFIGQNLIDLNLIADSRWSHLVEAIPELETSVSLFLRARTICGKPTHIPESISKLVYARERAEQELSYIRNLIGERPHDQGLAIRAENISRRLAARTPRLIEQKVDLMDKMYRLASTAELECLELMINKAFESRLIQITGAEGGSVKFDRFLMNAVQLMSEISYNKRLLKKLLSAHIQGDRTWRQRHPANERFLRALSERTDARKWLGRRVRRYEVSQLGPVRLVFEQDPLHILEMGNYFDTCLSFGGCYSYSTVANASDLNKRVIYAYDRRGKVVARQLIGISTEWKLVGFAIYSNIDDKPAVAAVNQAFGRFARELSQDLAIELDDEGEIESLTTPYWYCDGIEAWVKEDEAEPAPDESIASSSAHRRHSKSRALHSLVSD